MVTPQTRPDSPQRGVFAVCRDQSRRRGGDVSINVGRSGFGCRNSSRPHEVSRREDKRTEKESPKMFRWTTRSKARLISGVIGGLLMALTMLVAASPVAAGDNAADQIRSGDKVDLAWGEWVTRDDTLLPDFFHIRVFKSAVRSSEIGRAAGIGAILFWAQREFDPATGEIITTQYEGLNGVNDFDFRESFAGATANLDIELWGWRCVGPPAQGIVEASSDPQDPVCEDLPPASIQIQLQWTGVGEIYRSADNYSYNDDVPFFRIHTHQVSAMRQAEMTATFEGGDVVLPFPKGVAEIGWLIRGKYHEQWLWPR